MHNRLPVQCQLLVRCLHHRLQHRVCHQHVLLRHVHQHWYQWQHRVLNQQSHPVTSAIPQSDDVPVPQAFPYVTQTIDSDRDDVKVIARTPFGNTLVQHVCRDMDDVEANDAVVNKNWFRTVADAEAPRISSKMKQGVSTRLHMTRPQWVEERLRGGEAALWSGNWDNGPDSMSSSHALPPEEVQLPLHAMLQPSLEHIDAFLADEAKEMEQLAAQHLLTMSQNHPSTASETSSQEQERLRQEEEYEQALKEQEEMKKIKMTTIGSNTGSSCFEPVF